MMTACVIQYNHPKEGLIMLKVYKQRFKRYNPEYRPDASRWRLKRKALKHCFWNRRLTRAERRAQYVEYKLDMLADVYEELV